MTNNRENTAKNSFRKLPEIRLFKAAASDGSASPLRRSLDLILASLAIGFVNIQFGNILDLLLPLLGFAFGLLGWYRLRRENSGFCLGWILMLVRTGLFFLDTFRSFTLWGLNDLMSDTLIRIVLIGFVLLHAAQLYALQKGISLLQKKAGIKEDTLIITALIIWDIVLAFIAQSGVGGLVAIGMLLIVAVLLYQIWKLIRSLDEADCSIGPAPAGLSPTVLMGLFLGALLVGCLLSFVCFGRYAMKWTKHEAVYSPSSAAEIGAPTVPSDNDVIAGRLLALGFPEEILADLSEKDLKRCNGALKVYTRDCEQFGTVMDGLKVRSAAVVLSEEPRIWRIFYHFSLPDQKNYRGTDALVIRPTALYSYVPEITGEPEGLILREKSGKTYAAPITKIKKELCEQQTVIPFGEAWSGEAWFASFSLPRRFQNARGYVTLEVRDIYKDVDFSFGASAEDLIRSRWSNGLLYIHQISPWQYPVLSAKNYGMQNTGYSVGGIFLQIGLESWFFPGED